MELNEYIAEAEKVLAEIKNSLPASVDFFGYGIPSSIPAKIFSFKESLIHRVADISESAIQLAKCDVKVPAIILGRAIMETAAALYYLRIKAKRFLDEKIGIDDLDNYLMRSMFGAKHDEAKYKVVSIQTPIDEVNKQHPNFGILYNRTCEIVHPSWPGVQGAYAYLDTEDHKLYLGKEKSRLTYIDVWQPIFIGLLFFKIYYNENEALKEVAVQLNEIEWA